MLSLAPVLERVTPAEEAGLQPGDLIAAINGCSIGNANDLRNRIGLSECGSAIEITLYRGEESAAPLEIGDRAKGLLIETNYDVAAAYADTPGGAAGPHVGDEHTSDPPFARMLGRKHSEAYSSKLAIDTAALEKVARASVGDGTECRARQCPDPCHRAGING